MSPRSGVAATVIAMTYCLLVAGRAGAASLQPVPSWGATGVPGYISMYIYVPDRPATKPPVVVCSHYCGGTASGVFGEASGGGIVAAADKYGFIMIFPQTSNNCWDVGSTKSLTHDGGGDTQAVAEMVKYTLTKYGANPNRVYAMGTSSGAMMTEALLAIYPDVFKGGAEFSGVPAGCWAKNYSPSNQWSGPCAGGMNTMTGAQWGDMVRAMYPGYSGYRPRVQLWHGTNDTTINYANQTEAIKEWTNVLGLSMNPTSTTMVSLNNHTWTRQSWQSSCGVTVLDAWAEQNGPHGTDANLNATYVIPFLGLDKSGDVDPEVTACGGSGAVGTGGSGGGTGAGGSNGTGAGGVSPGTGGSLTGTGGAGGLPGTGGVVGSTGGGAPGNVAGSGNIGNGASGNAGAVGTIASGGVTGSGGALNGSGGTSGAGTGGNALVGGSAASSSPEPSGCTCTLGAAASRLPTHAAFWPALAILARRRRRMRVRHRTGTAPRRAGIPFAPDA